jgi:competence protein ComEC
VNALDLVIVTHADLDHYGGLASLLDEISVKEIWINGMTEGDKSYRDLIKRIQAKKISLKEIKEPGTLFLNEETKMQVLAPDADFLTVSNGSLFNPSPPWSVFCRFRPLTPSAKS